MQNKLRNSIGITLIALIITIVIILILAGIIILAIVNGGLIEKTRESEFKTRMAEYRDETNMYVSWKITENMDTNTDKINSGELLKNAIDMEIITDISKEEVTINIEDVLKKIKKSDKNSVVVYKGELYYVSDSKLKNNEKQVKWCNDIGIKVLEYKEPTGIIVKNGKYELVNGIYLCTPKLDEGFKTSKTRYLEVNGQENLEPGNWISDNPTERWYDYKNKKWANILVEEDGSEIYYTWIPRYCFKLDQAKQTSDVKFIDIDNTYKDEKGNITPWESKDGVKGLKEQGYQVPEAFTFNEQQLSGYWTMKYTVEDVKEKTIINYDMSSLKGVITLKNITLNTSITELNPISKYTIALNGKIIQTIDKESDIQDIENRTIILKNLKSGDNTINITGLNAGGEIVGSMTKEYSPAVVNAPDLSGFDKDTTYYVTYDDDGKEHSTMPISEKMPQYWYEYGENRWANIVTRNNGLETYYVWIPRYSFILDQKNQRSIIKFLSGTSTTVDSGYKIPEAFTFNGQELTGYWAMKYTLGNETVPKFDIEVTATSSSIKTKEITGTAKSDGQKYNYYLNGEYKGQNTNSSDTFEFSGLKNNTKYTILVEIRNKITDEYIGSITKQISTIDANKPDLSGFSEDYTYYVIYDNDGNETKREKIKKDGSNMPNNWYNYSDRKWANIVVEKDGNTTYFTWIPRYEFKINSIQQMQPALARTEVRFLSGTSTETDIGYKIPEAFTFNEQQLAGYWTMKYTVGK